MKFRLQELYQTIIDSDLSTENKVDLLMRIHSGRITDDYFLRGDTESGFDCILRKPRRDGKTDLELTNFTPDELIDIYKQDIKTKRR